MTESDRRRLEKAKVAYAALMKYYPRTLEDLPGEQWKPIPDYELYHVSNFGRVKSFKHKPKIIRVDLRGLYLSVRVYNGNVKKRFAVHRLVAQAFLPKPDGKPEIRHIDGNYFNNYVGNLAWISPNEIAEHSHIAKLTSEQVQYIRNNPDRLTCTQLGEKFGVHTNTISRVQIGKIYKNVGGSLRKSQVIPKEMRAQIRAEYVRGNGKLLAKKYGVNYATILNILRET